MKNQVINFKGRSEGVILKIKGSDLEEIKKELEDKLEQSLDFYKEMEFLGVEAEDLNPEEILDLNLLLKYKYGIKLGLEDILKESQEAYYERRLEEEKEARSLVEDLKEDYPTSFVYGTLRSGQEVDSKGHIVIIGDVNPGGVLKARGNIIVLGSLKGIAYAGLDGNQASVVAAYHLQPSQLRIADIIVRAPDGEEVWEAKSPEVAKIIKGEIIIEPYLPNK